MQELDPADQKVVKTKKQRFKSACLQKYLNILDMYIYIYNKYTLHVLIPYIYIQCYIYIPYQ